MPESIRVIAGRCTVRHEADQCTETEGEVLVLVKPDNTVLVHDADGYRPAGWLTRAESVQLSLSEGEFDLRAKSDDEQLRVTGDDPAVAEFPITAAGETVGVCPECGELLIRARGSVTCLGCEDSYPIPRDAVVTEDPCLDCGLPTLSVTRGTELSVCLDRNCEPIDQAVTEAFDAEWSCPTCGTALSIERNRTLGAACPTCNSHYPIPSGIVDGACDCGLPWFDTDQGGRCLDSDCEDGMESG